MEEARSQRNGKPDAVNKQAMLAAIIESSEDAIISKTLEGYITSWNHAAERIFGYTEAEAIGKHISFLIPQDRLGEEDMIIGRIRSGLRVEHFQTERITKNGGSISVSLTISPIRDNDGRIIGASKIARDITAQVKAQKELQTLYEEIRQLNARKDEFIGVAGHELRTPITSLKGYLQLLEEQAPGDLEKEFTKKAIRQVNKLNKLVTDLLDVTRIQAGKMEYRIIPGFLLPLVRESVETVRQMHVTHQIVTDLPGKDIVINADGMRIEQVLINFLTNAIKYSPAASKISLSVTKEENSVVVGVRDWGIGLTKEHQSHVFDRYYRAHTDPFVGGLGIGLHIAKEIIDRHGGTIGVDSQEGMGSLFYFSLPLPE